MTDIIIYSLLLLLGSTLYLLFFPVVIGETKESRRAKLKDYFKTIKLSHALFLGLGLSLLVLASHDLAVRLSNYLGLSNWFFNQFPNILSKFFIKNILKIVVNMLIAGLLASLSFVLLDLFIPSKFRKVI